MTRSIMDWDSGEWTTEPVSVTKEGLHLKVESREGSDYWEKTLYGFQRDSGHSLLTSWDQDAAMEVTFELDSFTELYDQAGIMLMNAPGQWIKAGIEINDGIPRLPRSSRMDIRIGRSRQCRSGLASVSRSVPRG